MIQNIHYNHLNFEERLLSPNLGFGLKLISILKNHCKSIANQGLLKISGVLSPWLSNPWFYQIQRDLNSVLTTKSTSVSSSMVMETESPNTLSLEELYKKYSAALYWVCSRYTRNREDAEDMVHQVFMKVHLNRHQFQGGSSIYTWIYRIAVNECLQMLRKKKFEKEGELFPGLENKLVYFPERTMDAKLILEKITKTVDIKTMEILFLLYLEDHKQEDVAEMLNISRATVNRKIAHFKILMTRFKW